MQIKKSRVFSQADFDAADRLGKIYIHLVEPNRFVLTERDQTYLERLRVVWGIVVDNSTQRKRTKLISAALEVNERSVRDLVDDAIHLFGDILKVDADFEKAFIAEKLWLLHDKAKQAGDFDTAGRMLGLITKLRGYDREDGGIRREDLALPEITFTDNPKALSEGVEGDYLDYEEGDVLEPEAIGLPAGKSAD